MIPPNSLISYDAPPALEGPDNGFLEEFADRLWSFRSRYYRARGDSFEKQSPQVKYQWRETAKHMLDFLGSTGFIGPAGPPRQDRFDGWTYAWVYQAHEWEVIDADGGYIALVRETPDLEVIMAAPEMRNAIKALLAAIPDDHPARALPEMQALENSLPERQGERLWSTAQLEARRA